MGILTDEQRAAMLQREIEMLLRDAPADATDPAATAIAPAEAVVEGAVDESPTLGQVGEHAAAGVAADAPRVGAQAKEPAPAPLANDISRDELDVLLAQEGADAMAKAVPGPVAAKNDQPLVSEAEAEQKLSEAEGVLADELAKLMEESAPAGAPAAPETAAPPVAPAATVEAAADAVNPADAALADELAQLMATPMAGAAPVPESTAETKPVAASATAASSSPTATASTAAAPALVAAATTTPGAAQVQPSVAPNSPASPAPQRLGFGQRLVALVSGLMLTLAQLLDLPFAWMDDLSRNVIGVAAFMLLLGGVVLWALSRTALLGG